jgi:nitroreductase
LQPWKFIVITDPVMRQKLFPRIQAASCPMAGFKPNEYDEILGLTAKGFGSVVCCAAGYRDVADKYAAHKKVRFKRDDVIQIV